MNFILLSYCAGAAAAAREEARRGPRRAMTARGRRARDPLGRTVSRSEERRCVALLGAAWRSSALLGAARSGAAAVRSGRAVRVCVACAARRGRSAPAPSPPQSWNYEAGLKRSLACIFFHVFHLFDFREIAYLRPFKKVRLVL